MPQQGKYTAEDLFSIIEGRQQVILTLLSALKGAFIIVKLVRASAVVVFASYSMGRQDMKLG